ncbi:RdgB/HAM1 family non-canonical purine NTP pyrophosphatase [soil metagenome]
MTGPPTARPPMTRPPMTGPPARPTFVVASTNPGKVAEMADILGRVVDLEPRPDWVPDVVEDADTLAGNARLKAAAIATATGRPALADDTGLEVAALDGAPGVHTGRYAGEGATDADNRAKLLTALRHLGNTADRSARFRTVVTVVWPDGREVGAEGTCAGRIEREERGDRGFGYDSLFVPDDGDGRTFAQMSADEKHAVSHRGRALTALMTGLSGEGAPP